MQFLRASSFVFQFVFILPGTSIVPAGNQTIPEKRGKIKPLFPKAAADAQSKPVNAPPHPAQLATVSHYSLKKTVERGNVSHFLAWHQRRLPSRCGSQILARPTMTRDHNLTRDQTRLGGYRFLQDHPEIIVVEAGGIAAGNFQIDVFQRFQVLHQCLGRIRRKIP